MRTCPYCKIKVGGTTETCPLCQSPVIGDEAEEAYWPSFAKLKQMSLLAKILLFLVLSDCVICVAVDFLFTESVHRHWSVPMLIWVFTWLLMIVHFVKSYKSAPKILLQSMIVLSVLTVYTGWFGGFRKVAIDLLVPIYCCITLVTNFVFSFIRAKFTENAMVCMLCNVVIGVIPYVALLLHRGNAPVAWTVSLIMSMITFIGLVIFQGKKVFLEIQKRLHM